MKKHLILCVFVLSGLLAANVSGKDPVTPQDKPAYQLLNLPVVNLTDFPKDANGWITIFDGKTLNGWRGYGKTIVPTCWTVEDNAIKIISRQTRPQGENNRGDLIFAHKFKDFELEFEWKVAQGANSGVMYKILEVERQAAHMSSPEFQILDNVNHPDAKMGKDNNRQSSSLYDMIPAKPQNSKPFGEWNSSKIKVEKGTITHYQNGVAVVTYRMWTQQWRDMLNESKFSQAASPVGFELLSNCGGPDRSGFIGLQDHGNDVWFRNFRIRVIE